MPDPISRPGWRCATATTGRPRTISKRALRADPGNPLLISNAVFANAALGRWDAAAVIAEDLPEDATGQELAGLVTFVDTVSAGDLDAARAALEAGRGGGPFVDELSMGWIEFGAGNMDRAVAVFEELATDQSLSELAWLHLGLARAAVGDFEAADEILSGERTGRISQTERVVRARAEILVQLGLRGDALDLLDGYTQRVPDPALLALQARIGAGAEEPYSFVTSWQEGISEVFLTVSQALGADGNGQLPLIYARAAWAISPQKHRRADPCRPDPDRGRAIRARRRGLRRRSGGRRSVCGGADGPRRGPRAAGRSRRRARDA